MKIRPNAEIDADFPDDQIEDGDNILVFGGRGIADAIADKFRTLGHKVSELEHEDGHGWVFQVGIEGNWIGFQVSDLDGAYLLMSESATFFTKARPQHVRLLIQLNAELAHDPRFKRVRWFVNDDILSGKPGDETPVDEG